MHKDFEEFIKRLSNYSTLSIIGLEKNTGKTTTLNAILKAVKDRKLAITSIGRDGEKIDLVTSTHKPRIYIQESILVATAKSVLLKSDVTFEILEALNIGTPMGDIVIGRSLSSGFVEIAGPSTKNQIKYVISRLKEHGAELTIVDGALSRKSFAAPLITEASVICTGGAFSENLNSLVEETINLVEVMSIETIDGKLRDIYNKVMLNSKLAFVYEDGIKESSVKTAIDSAEEVISNYNDFLRYVFIKGIVTDSFISKLLASRLKLDKLVFVAEDGTKIFLKKPTFERFKLKGGIIKAANQISIVGISVNPWSPSGYVLDYKDMYDELKKGLSMPVFNVKEYNLDVIE